MTTTITPWVFNDGGRSAAGFKGQTRDCVTRAIAIAMKQRYILVYNDISILRLTPIRRECTARKGIHVEEPWFQKYMTDRGWSFVKVDGVNLEDFIFPAGTVIAHVPRHYTVVIDNIINDTYDPRPAPLKGYWINTSTKLTSPVQSPYTALQ